ncbi:MAG: DUF465 domain-containing protein [Rhodobacteraceae bacterium]|nr:DUF465 domain-containing protein [Paracoccaceae bacterium]
MNLNSHLIELKKKHENLSHRIESDQRSPGANGLNIGVMKKEKLLLKEEIFRVSAQL